MFGNGADMLALQILILACLLLLIPVIVGSMFLSVDKNVGKLPLAWISGQMLLWAGFQVITVPLVLQEAEFDRVVQLYLGYIVVLVVAAVIAYVIRRKKAPANLRLVEENTGLKNKKYYLLWAVFWVLIIFQLVQAVRLAYADGDDAFYVATAAIAEESNLMYRKLVYTGGFTELDARYGLAPFPIWISFLARVSGMQPVSVAHVVLSPVLIAMAYGVFYLLASRLFAKSKEHIPLFMIFVELLVLFGNYSIYTAERFMIERSRQGKAALGSIVIPLLIFLLFILIEKIQENRKPTVSYWVLFLCTLLAACLCSTLGTMLTCMLVGVTGLCTAVSYRKWKILFPLAACCAPCVVFAVLYLML